MTLSERFFIGRVGLAMISQCTKFEVSRFTRYEAMNGGAKCRKSGGLGWLGVTQGHRHFNTNHVSILYCFRDIASYLPKVADLTHLTCIWHPHRGWPRSNFAEIFGIRKLEWAIVCCCLYDPTFGRFSRTLTCNRETDERTDGHRAMASTCLLYTSPSPRD